MSWAEQLKAGKLMFGLTVCPLTHFLMPLRLWKYILATAHA